MHFKLGRNLFGEFGNANILHNNGIGTCFGDGGQCFAGFGQFMLKYQRVKGEVAAHPALVQGAHHFGQFV